MIPVTLVQGDTNDTHVIGRMQELFDASGASVVLRPYDARDGRVTPELVGAIRETGLALMGFQWGRRDQGAVPPMVELRRALGVYANVRPIKSLPGVPSKFDDVDLIIETAERVDWPWMDASSNAKRRTSSCSAHSPRSMSDTPNRRTVNTENDRNDRAIHRLLP